MEPEDKNRYQQMAGQVSVSSTPDVAVTSHYDKLHEARRVVAKIHVNYMHYRLCELMFAWCILCFSVIGLLNSESIFVTWLVLTSIILLEGQKEGTNFYLIIPI